jgi:hypothetical protein
MHQVNIIADLILIATTARFERKFERKNDTNNGDLTFMITKSIFFVTFCRFTYGIIDTI